METSNLQEHPDYPGFYKVPFTDWVVASKDRRVVSTATGNELTPILRNHGYLSINVKRRINNAKVERQFLLHRLIAATFIPVPKDLQAFKKLQVNHKDGDKLNNEIFNLEWMRAQDNMKHAFTNKLITRGKDVLAKDVRNGEIEKYPSMNELARVLDISLQMLIRHLRSKKAGTETINWRVFKYDDGKAWPTLQPHQLKSNTFGIRRVMLAKNAETGITVVAKNLKIFCQTAGLNATKIKRKIQYYGYGAEIDGWFFFKEIDLSDVDLDQLNCIALRGTSKDTRMFDVKDTITGEKFQVIGARELAVLTKYEEFYLRKHVNQCNKENKMCQVGHFEITLVDKQVGTQNPMC